MKYPKWYVGKCEVCKKEDVFETVVIPYEASIGIKDLCRGCKLLIKVAKGI